MLYLFKIHKEDIAKISAPTEEDAWDRLFEVTDADTANDIECSCIGEE